MGEILYRISPLDELEAFKQTGLLQGGELDISTGFIHLSKASQLGDGLKYERVDGMMEGNAVDNVFPHFYGPSEEFCPLPGEAVIEVHKLELHEGKHLLPF